jgi:hypothetical protein
LASPSVLGGFKEFFEVFPSWAFNDSISPSAAASAASASARPARSVASSASKPCRRASMNTTSRASASYDGAG